MHCLVLTQPGELTARSASRVTDALFAQGTIQELAVAPHSYDLVVGTIVSLEIQHLSRSKRHPGQVRLSSGSLHLDNGSAAVLHACPWDIGAMVRFRFTAYWHFNKLLAESQPRK